MTERPAVQRLANDHALAASNPTPAVHLRDAGLTFGDRTLWDHLSLDIAPGEFVAVLGPNGAGKTSLLRVLLGMQKLTTGSVTVDGRPVNRGSRRIGYVPQQRNFDPTLPVRARDLVSFGVDGHRWGIPLPSRSRTAAVNRALAQVGATRYADAPVGMLSGGEQQRLRIAQALVTDPSVLLCDEPLLSLDLAHQQAVADLIDKRRKEFDTAVVFVTHEINPILPMVDRVLYLVDGRFRIGAPDEVMTSSVLSELYGAPIDVLHAGDQIVVLGTDHHAHHGEHDVVKAIP
ncbi:metal ABC transporter ATP-binding protein [Nakamurella aerolata]|uniref:ABC transporter ATP-binding protein n=1 Tax=Nakamurella aerolata TaxID=1656892 RepID=A0A849A378_9ACTN|nr:ABC transporter ATP-binding protein [Nakamurella aerolata]NNG35484.1 ABC transporter ATP-binding protein [Nakamurella aerolata]